jgi:hypothetical protein
MRKKLQEMPERLGPLRHFHQQAEMRMHEVRGAGFAGFQKYLYQPQAIA